MFIGRRSDKILKTRRALMISVFLMVLIVFSSFVQCSAGQGSAGVAQAAELTGLKILVLGSTAKVGANYYADLEGSRLSGLGASVTVKKGSAVSSYLTSANLKKFQVVYLASNWWGIRGILDQKYLLIKSWVMNGGGLVVGQCNPARVPYRPRFIPKVIYTSASFPSTCGLTILNSNHYITNGLSPDKMPDVYDKIPIDSGHLCPKCYEALVRHATEPVLSLAAGAPQGAKGRIVVTTGDWQDRTHCNGTPDDVIVRIFKWVSRRV